MKPNRLIYEKSPYLLQHAYNPVDWYPWGEEAFARAKELNRPIFLSIGYATCHWCHVMERESFEDHDVAEKMNRFFVSIKVDREELPEVDRLYMEFAQGMISGPAGWPLNLILTPDLHPFFAFTYSPPRTQEGSIGLIDLIEKIQQIWEGADREQISAEMEKIVELFAKSIHTRGEKLPSEEAISETASMLYKISDPIYGGIKGAPKFPAFHQMRFLMHYAYLKADSRALFVVQKTLDSMSSGGIYDHLGGGFCRYSTDEAWLIPHFEKMLSDNAQLALLYLEGWKLTGKRAYADICRQTLDYVARDMTNLEGGFYSAEDADSEGEEGLFYTWTQKEIFDVFDPSEAKLLCDFFAITEEGNFEGRNVLSLPTEILYFAEQKGMSFPELESRIQILKQQLWEVREQRPRPFRDDKVLTSWNGLMLNAFAQAGSTLGLSYYLERAVSCARFLKKFMWKEGFLLHRWREGEAKFVGNLEDYAFLIKGLLSLFEAGCGVEWLEWSIELASVLERKFKSPKGAFFQIEEGASHCLLRLCVFSDGAEPSGNAVQCENLLRLHQITSEPRFLDQAHEILTASNKYFDSYSPAYAYHASNLLYFYDRSSPSIVVVLNQNSDYHREIFDLIYGRFRPHLTVIWKQETEEQLVSIIPSLKAQVCQKDHTTVYICRQGVCERPLTDIEEIRHALFSL